MCVSVFVHVCVCDYGHTHQLTEAKKKYDELQAEVEETSVARRKQDKELEGARERIDELTTENQKLSQSKKRVQEEVSGREGMVGGGR